MTDQFVGDPPVADEADRDADVLDDAVVAELHRLPDEPLRGIAGHPVFGLVAGPPRRFDHLQKGVAVRHEQYFMGWRDDSHEIS